MASTAASAFLEAVMGKLFMVLDKEYNKHKALDQEIWSLQQEFRMIAAAMDDQLLSMGRSDARTAVARLHAEEMLDLEHDIEDCIDRFMHLLTCKHNRSESSLVRRVKHEVRKVQSRSSFGDEIQKLRRRLSEAQQRVININPPIGGQPAGSSSSTPCRAARSPVGIEEPVEELLSLLDEVEGEPEQMRVISVVGFGGLGKTTLAKAVYDSPRTKEKFPHRAWVAAGGLPAIGEGMRGILCAVLQQVLPNGAMGVDGHHDLETSLKVFLKDKRYLIVMDDIGMDQWSTIRSTFEDNGTSSRIILTTTVQSVAKMCSHGNGYVYQMNTLGEEDSKELAFPGFRSPELEQGSTSLLGKCDGLPLALVSVSDYLKSSSEPTGELCAKLCRNLGVHLKEQDGHYSFSELRKAIQEFTKAPIDRDIDHSLSLDSEECPKDFLSSLDLETCSEATLTQVHLSALINLNRLLYLKLVAYKLENFEIKHGAFQSLRRLCFVVKSVTSALPTIKHGALPNLVSLQLLSQGVVGLSGIEIRHMKHLKEITINSGVAVQWEQAAKNHPNRPKVLFLRKVDPMESEELGRPCAIKEQREISVAQPTCSDDGLYSSLNKMRLSEPSSSQIRVITHPVAVMATEAAPQPSFANL
ncbi:hypothetical protein E2562_024288 [Oryza meyeriana var. granulata]|uniref:NB-ARC domain-containing protein n=1 Tax=Oryza meyeriana var. granulata TaxID=110450 RepID=A0A6G1C9X7_9ORYZ|nr:hypothetical protein E2562_024288 [Oryza meyeriana var. granulata]